MPRAWADFALTGNPGWPGYRPPSRPVMLFDTSCAIINGQPPLSGGPGSRLS